MKYSTAIETTNAHQYPRLNCIRMVMLGMLLAYEGKEWEDVFVDEKGGDVDPYREHVRSLVERVRGHMEAAGVDDVEQRLGKIVTCAYSTYGLLPTRNGIKDLPDYIGERWSGK